MNRYNIFCTEEQTKKAFELGAPIVILPNYEEYKGFPFVRHTNGNEYPCAIPTAEQMIGWLEEQDDINVIEVGRAIKWGYQIFNKEYWQIMKNSTFYDSRKEATLAAIDVALDFLSNIKKE